MLIWRCDRAKLYPPFAQACDDVIGPLKGTFYAISGARGLEEQEVLYQKYLNGGAKAAPPGQSAHNHAAAIDVVSDVDRKAGLQPSWDLKRPEWKELVLAVMADARLVSGKSFGDSPHVEWRHWRELPMVP